MLSTEESHIEMYNQIVVDLQKKLKQSEAERIRLEEMFDFLLKSLREEEEMQMKSVENRYHAFLEDCARRNSRNEKILRSVERIENAAKVLHAKSERLKLLRNYYEGYLERIIPFWKQPSLYYGPSQFSYNELDWMRRRQLISEKVPENISPLLQNANFEGSKSFHLNEVNNHLIVPESERKQFVRSLTSSWKNLSKNIWTQTNKENDSENMLGEYHSVQNDNIVPSSPSSVAPNKLLDHPNKFRCDYFQEEPEQKNVELINTGEHSFPQNLLENNWELLQSNLRQQNFPNVEKNNSTENSYHILCHNDASNKSKTSVIPSEEREFGIKGASDKRKNKITAEEKMLEKHFIVREPVEIKKPEFMVGKLHPDTTMTVEGLKNTARHENLEKENLDKKIENAVESENISIPRNHEEKSLLGSSRSMDVKIEENNKWNMLKQQDNVDNLKKTLSENQIDLDENSMKLTKSMNRLSLAESQSSLKPITTKAAMDNKCESENNEQSLRLPSDKEEKFPYEDQKIILAEEKYELGEDDDKSKSVPENVDEPEGQFNNEIFPQKESTCDLVEEVYEDNEESYPESYFEQPPKSHFPTNIVSNVILEEDESEVNSNDACAEIEYDNDALQENVEAENFENAAENVDEADNQNDFNELHPDGAPELCDNLNLYENMMPDERSIGNNQMNFYADENNPNSFPEQRIYENPGSSHDGYLLQEQGNNDVGEHHVDNSFTEHCFEDEKSREIIGERQIYGGQPSEQNMEITPELEHYVNQDVPYQMQYCEQLSNEGRDLYYEQEGMNEQYFQNNFEQGNNFKQNEESTENLLQVHIGQNQPDAESGYHRQSINNLAHLLESDSESFQIEHGSGIGNEDSDFDFSVSQQ